MAQKYVVGDQNRQVRFFSQIEHSTAVTFEIMRLGFGYVIANSCFSWWSAFLRYDKNAKVIAPETWFKALESPKCLFPSDWSLTQSTWREI